MFKSIDEVIDFYFKEWRNLPEEQLVKNTRKLWLLIGDHNAFTDNKERTWNRVVQDYKKPTMRRFSCYTFAYVNQDIVLIDPTGRISILSGSDKNDFISDVDYTVDYKTDENSANQAISDLINKKYKRGYEYK